MASFPGSPLHRPYPKLSDCLSPSCFRTQLHAGVKAAAAGTSSAVRDKGSSGSERGKGSCDSAYAGSVSEPPWDSSYGGTATAHAQIHVGLPHQPFYPNTAPLRGEGTSAMGWQSTYLKGM